MSDVRIDYGTYRFSIWEWIRYSCLGLGIGGFAVWICYHSIKAFPAALGLAVIYVRARKKALALERQRTMNYHFRDFLSALHTAMMAGYSLENGVRQAAGDLEKLYGKQDDLVRELKYMARQMEYRKPVEKLFRDLGKRSHVEDIDCFGEIVMIAKRTGGNMDQVLTSAWRNLSGKIDTRQEVDTVIAARRYEQTMMSFMPAGIILYLRLTFRGFLEQLYGNVTGVIVMTICLIAYLISIAVGRKMTDIRV